MLGTFIVLYFSISNLGFAFSDLIDSSLDHLMTTIESLKMAEENQDGQEKTEDPSQRKIDKYKEDGKVLNSKEMFVFTGIAGALLAYVCFFI